MAEAKSLKTFRVAPAGKDFTLHVEDESGQVIELVATREQIDVIVDDLDDKLSLDDAADEVPESGSQRR